MEQNGPTQKFKEASKMEAEEDNTNMVEPDNLQAANARNVSDLYVRNASFCDHIRNWMFPSFLPFFFRI